MSLKQSNSIIHKKMEIYNKLKDLLIDNMGYIGKFTEYLLSNNITYKEFEKLYYNLTYLSKAKYAIDINNKTYEQVLDEIQINYNDLSIKSFINKLPSLQKNICRNSLSDYSFYNLLLKASEKENNLEPFLSKVSRYKDYSGLRTAITLLSKDIKNDKETVKTFVNKSKNSEIVLEKK